MLDLLMEETARQLLLVVRRYLDDELVAVTTEMAAKDAAFFAEMGQPVPDTTLPTVATWLTGHHLTVLDRPLTDFPTLSTMCYNVTSARDATDQVEYQLLTAYIEAFMSHSDPSTINRFAWRYAKALHRAVWKHRTLDNFCEPIDFLPDVAVSNATTRRLAADSEQFVYMQGCRLEYIFRVPQRVD